MTFLAAGPRSTASGPRIPALTCSGLHEVVGLLTKTQSEFLVAIKDMGLLVKTSHREHSQPDGFSHAFYEAFKGRITWVLCKLFF